MGVGAQSLRSRDRLQESGEIESLECTQSELDAGEEKEKEKGQIFTAHRRCPSLITD